MAQDYLEIGFLGFSSADPIIQKPIANVFQYRRTVALATPDKADIKTSWMTSIGSIILLALNEDYVQTFVTVRFFDDALDAPIYYPLSGVGAVTGQRSPNYVTATVRLKSNVRTRSGRGRKSFSPITEVSTTGDNLSTSGQTLFNAVAATILAGFNDSSSNQWRPVIKSGKPPAQYLVNPVVVVAYDVVQASANTNLGSLLRRKVKV